MIPIWTVLTNIVSVENSAWVGMSWEFFDEEVDADECVERHIVLGNVPTKRRFHRTDVDHMGAVHRDRVREEIEHRSRKTC